MRHKTSLTLEVEDAVTTKFHDMTVDKTMHGVIVSVDETKQVLLRVWNGNLQVFIGNNTLPISEIHLPWKESK